MKKPFIMPIENFSESKFSLRNYNEEWHNNNDIWFKN